MILSAKRVLTVVVGDLIAGGNQVLAGWAQNRLHRRLIMILDRGGESIGASAAELKVFWPDSCAVAI